MRPPAPAIGRGDDTLRRRALGSVLLNSLPKFVTRVRLAIDSGHWARGTARDSRGYFGVQKAGFSGFFGTPSIRLAYY
jgi:hypothetical protein